MTDPLAQITTKVTPQTQQADPDQVANNAGGFSFKVSPEQQLERFLILGTWGGTYYVSEKELTKEHYDNIVKVINKLGTKAIDIIVDVSLNGRAYKQQPTMFALAVCASYTQDVTVRQEALKNLNRICRTGTMLFDFVRYAEQFRGWGSAMQKAVANWYTAKSPDQLANQVVKYNQRNGWSHRDLLRLSKPKISDDNPITSTVRYVVGKEHGELPDMITGSLKAHATTSEKEWVKLIEEYKLPWEALPTQALNSPKVWNALVPTLGLTAVFRNLGKMGSCGALVHHSDLAKIVKDRIGDENALREARVHPMQVLLAQTTYASGRGVKGKNSWEPVPSVVDALDAAFYKSFGNLPATGKRRLLALDVSGSMGWSTIAGTHITPRVASGALAMVALHQDPDSYVYGFSTTLAPINISKGMRLDSVLNTISRIPMGGTDCSLPMVHALKNKLGVDSFEVYTDSDTYAGRSHPHQELKKYRNTINPHAKLIVNGMQSTGFTIADPKDPGSLDVVGFDANTPRVISDFIA